MKHYFSLKSLFLGLLLMAAGTMGLINNANAGGLYNHNHERQYYRGKHIHQYHGGYYNDYYSQGYKAKRMNRHYRNHGERRRYHHKGYHNSRNHYRDYGYDRKFSRHRPNKHQCYNFRVKALGGLGGFRFQHNIKNFKRFYRNGYSGKICGHRHVEFELSKMDPGVKVVLEINGQHFVYNEHSGHDRHINNWHRKYYSIRLGR